MCVCVSAAGFFFHMMHRSMYIYLNMLLNICYNIYIYIYTQTLLTAGFALCSSGSSLSLSGAGNDSDVFVR